jgi:hypothetical protein
MMLLTSFVLELLSVSMTVSPVWIALTLEDWPLSVTVVLLVTSYVLVPPPRVWTLMLELLTAVTVPKARLPPRKFPRDPVLF